MMEKYIFIFILTGSCAIAAGCSNDKLLHKIAEGEDVLESSLAFANEDTTSCTLSLQVQNVSSIKVLVPTSYYVTSNLVPNGNSSSVEGALIHIDVETGSDTDGLGRVTDYFTVKYIENQIYEGLGELVELGPGETHSYTINLSNHLYQKSDTAVDLALSIMASFQITELHMDRPGNGAIVFAESNDVVVLYPCSS